MSRTHKGALVLYMFIGYKVKRLRGEQLKRQMSGSLWSLHFPHDKRIAARMVKSIQPRSSVRGLASARLSPVSADTIELTWHSKVSYNSVYAWCTNNIDADSAWALQCNEDVGGIAEAQLALKGRAGSPTGSGQGRQRQVNQLGACETGSRFE